MISKRKRGAMGSSVTAADDARVVKRSIRVRRDLDEAVVEIAGRRQYSAFVNEALLVALQAKEIAESVIAFEGEHGAISAEEKRSARARRAAGVVAGKS